MPDDIRILSTTEAQRPDDAGRYRTTIVTRFTVGADGPFEVTQPEATFDPAIQTQKMNEKAELVRALRR